VDNAIIGSLGATSSQLADFGIQPKKARKKLSSEELVARKDKAARTRAKNHPKPETPPAEGGAPPAAKT
jgi:hypothetical protein